MQITIIGTGNMARGIPTHALAGGHTVLIIDRAPDKAARLAAGPLSVTTRLTLAGTGAQSRCGCRYCPPLKDAGVMAEFTRDTAPTPQAAPDDENGTASRTRRTSRTAPRPAPPPWHPLPTARAGATPRARWRCSPPTPGTSCSWTRLPRNRLSS